MNKINIFNEIVEILNNDYAGYSAKKHLNQPEKYHITNEMTDEEFVKTVQSYLLDFNDGHLYFNKSDAATTNRGFKVRRYENSLYVTEVTKDSRFKLGDKIIKIDSLTINEFANKHLKLLEDYIHERQYWNVGLQNADKVLLVRDNEELIFHLKNDEWEPYIPTFTFKQIDAKTSYLKIESFADAEPIQKLLQEHSLEITQSSNLIIDVRINHGGNDTFYFPLLDYIFDKNISFQDLFEDDETMYTNYTKRNCDLWLEELKEYLKQNLDESTEWLIQEEIKMVEKNYDKGMKLVPEDTDHMICGKNKPKNIYVLSDVFCGSSGETFVANVKKSSKVTVVGRPTMGIMDYFNVITVHFDNYEFDYSISKMHEKYHYNQTGVVPDIYIPWTPEHIEHDLDLQYVLNLINK